MADTDVAVSAGTNPTEAPKTATADVKADTKVETAANDKAATSDDGEKKPALNGNTKSEERGGRRDRDDRNGRNGFRDGGRGRGRGRGGFQNNHHKRRNHEFNDLPETDDPEEIRQQVEFYFSTHNLWTDEHMFLELEGPKNRPVSIKHITSFKRMRRFQPYSAVVKALRDSKDLEVVEENGQEAVRRKEPLVVPTEEGDEERPPTVQQLFYRLKKRSSNDLSKSVYVKNFGGDGEVGQITLEQFFRPYGSVMVRKRRDDEQQWKGSVFVEFDSEDSQKQVLALDPAPKFNDNELLIMGKKEYIVMKCKEKGVKPDWELTEEELAAKRRERTRDGDRGRGRSNFNNRGGRGGRGGRGRGGRDFGRNRSRSPRRRRDSGDSADSRDWNTRRDRFQKGKDDRPKERKEIERDATGVPIIKATDPEEETRASNKRKANDDERDGSPKKSKIEIKEDA